MGIMSALLRWTLVCKNGASNLIIDKISCCWVCYIGVSAARCTVWSVQLTAVTHFWILCAKFWQARSGFAFSLIALASSCATTPSFSQYLLRYWRDRHYSGILSIFLCIREDLNNGSQLSKLEDCNTCNHAGRDELQCTVISSSGVFSWLIYLETDCSQRNSST